MRKEGRERQTIIKLHLVKQSILLSFKLLALFVKGIELPLYQ